jgi:hypothetical protein
VTSEVWAARLDGGYLGNDWVKELLADLAASERSDAIRLEALAESERLRVEAEHDYGVVCEQAEKAEGERDKWREIWEHNEPMLRERLRLATIDANTLEAEANDLRATFDRTVAAWKREKGEGEMSDTFCPECGWDVSVDEDGLCTGCGATAIGVGVRKLVLERNTLRRELEEARATLARYPERWYSEQTMAAVVKERDDANAKLAAVEAFAAERASRAAAVTFDNAAVRKAAQELWNAVAHDVEDESKWVGTAMATLQDALASSPDAMVQEVRGYMRHTWGCEQYRDSTDDDEDIERLPCTCGLDALLASLGAGEGGKV